MVVAIPCLPFWVAAVTAQESDQRPVTPQLSPLYFEHCRRPCQFVGFSFDDEPAEMREMRDHGANACGSGSMWVPVQDPQAPHGAGVPDLGYMRDVVQLGQSFTAEAPFTGVALCTPTFSTQGGGCALALYGSPPETWQGAPPTPLAMQTLTDVADNQTSWLIFDELPLGTYYLEQTTPTGPGIGVWALGADGYPAGCAYVNRLPITADDLELAVRWGAGDQWLVPASPSHHALRLGPGFAGRMADAGLAFDYAVGNWNNGGFPYYPKWFIDRFPEHAMLDQAGRPIMCGMFGELAPWPNLDNAVIADGTARYIRAVVSALKDHPGLLYWCMGGEALYATYLMPDRWTDYSPDAIAHYRAWLRREHADIAALNRAWGTRHEGWDDIQPPAEPGRDRPTLDWFRFRNAAMAERFRLHFIATKGADPARLVVTCNHGDIFQGMAATRLGQDLALCAGVSDGWEMGQIVSDEDPDLFNLMWMRAAGAFGKPLCPVRLAYRKSNPRARGGGTSFTPQAARRYFWESVGTGAWHLGFIQWRGSLPDGEWGVKGTPAQQTLGELFRDWHAMEGYFDDAWPVREPVGLYFSQLTWTLDGFQEVWTRLHRELTRRQIGYCILLDEQVAARDFEGVSVIISADNRILSGSCADALSRFAADGGALALIGANALEDEHLGGGGASRLAPSATRLPADDPALMDRLEELVSARAARNLTVEARSQTPYVEPRMTEIAAPHDTPFDLAGHTSVGQSFTVTEGGLRSVSVSNPTYNKTVADHSLRMELLADGPEGPVLARKTYPAEDLTDNASHEVSLDQPAPAGTYYLRLVTPPDLPPSTLGVWGTRADSYGGGTRYVDDAPAEGDLRARLRCEVEAPARAALEAFTLSDGLNAIVILTNIAAVPVEAQVGVAPGTLPTERYTVRDLAANASLGQVGRGAAAVPVSIPAHDSAVLYFGAQTGQEELGGRIRRAEDALEGLPEETVRPHRAHLTSARDALAAGRPEKALACVRLAETRAPVAVSATATAAGLRVQAQVLGAPSTIDPVDLQARFVPIPGLSVCLEPQGAGGFSTELPWSALGTRYDYAAREYVSYHGALEVQVTGAIGNGVAAASRVVEVPRR